MSESSSSNKSESDSQKPKKLSLRKPMPVEVNEVEVNANDEAQIPSENVAEEIMNPKKETAESTEIEMPASRPKLSLKKASSSEVVEDDSASDPDVGLAEKVGAEEADEEKVEAVGHELIDGDQEIDSDETDSEERREAIDLVLGSNDDVGGEDTIEEPSEDVESSPVDEPVGQEDGLNEPMLSMEEFRRAHHKENEKPEVSVLPTVLGMGLVMLLILLAGGLLVYKALSSEDKEADALAEVVEVEEPVESVPVMSGADNQDANAASAESSEGKGFAVIEDALQEASTHVNEVDALVAEPEAVIDEGLVQPLDSDDRGQEDGSAESGGVDVLSGERVLAHDSAEIISEAIVEAVEAKPSLAVQAYVAGLTVNMVKKDALNQIQVVLDRVVYRPGDVVSHELQLVLNRVDLEGRKLIFTDPQQWEYLLLY